MYGSYECDACGKRFGSIRAAHQHMEVKNHWPFECSCCYRTFPDQAERRTHEHNVHIHCSDCQRNFDNHNNLRMHLNSSRHRGSTVTCPGCERRFTSATGLAHHLEAGACSRMNTDRDTVYRLVRSRDPSGVISKNLLEYHGSSSYEASSQSWNGFGYECYLCHREFRMLAGLNQHLNSPAHQQALYHCPNLHCPDFKSLAGIINHLESETCGITRFDAVQRSVTNMISRGHLLEM